ncbi:MAG TPA: DUF3857 domain-containing protein [Candidatus Acidoferrum sp.]|nr:DUF3857 domain-containing protein [Candidatus Acidoferrum sp.]
MKATRFFLSAIPVIAVVCFLSAAAANSRAGQAASQKPAEKAPEKNQEKTQDKSAAKLAPKIPAEIELLETRIRFEANGDSRKEVHARVKINDELGARQFARLNFDFNRGFEQIEIPLVRITHPSGGTADVLPSAITDTPNPAVVNAPAYQDVRGKSVRILGLEPGDVLEYRVITTRTNPPLKLAEWPSHTFDHAGVVAHEIFELDLPPSLAPADMYVVKNEQMRQELQGRQSYPPQGWMNRELRELSPDELKNLPIQLESPKKATRSKRAAPTDNPAVLPQSTPTAMESSEPERLQPPGTTDELPADDPKRIQLYVSREAPAVSIQKTGEGEDSRVLCRWDRTAPAKEPERAADADIAQDMPDIELGHTLSWWGLSHQLYYAMLPPKELPAEVTGQADKLTRDAKTPEEKAQRIFDFVSQKITTVDLPLGATGFKPRPVAEVLSSGYANPEDKFVLLESLGSAANIGFAGLLIGPSKKIGPIVGNPSAFTHLVIQDGYPGGWGDPSLEVAPLGLLPPAYLGSMALVLGEWSEIHDVPSEVWSGIPKSLPFPSSQKVNLNASLDAEGKLTTKAKYVIRGNNELLLRVAFHKTPKENWKNIAQLLALSDGFRGQIANVTTSDPYATHDPFIVEYEITQPKFVDWSKKPLRIPALLPVLGLPDPPAKPPVAGAPPPIDLGTPLDVELNAALHLPAGTIAHTPAGTSVQRDFATYTSLYSAKDATITASRHLNFILKEIPADRAADYNAFLHAVQSDESQVFTLERAEAAPPPPQKP